MFSLGAQAGNSAGNVEFQKRSTLVLFAFSFWFLVITIALFHFMVYGRKGQLEKMETKIGVQIIPPLRGSILDWRGNPLAWSVRQFDLLWRVPKSEARAKRELAQFTSAFPGLRLPDPLALPYGSLFPLKADITPEECRLWKDGVETFRSVCIRSAFKRCHANMSLKLRQKIGRVEIVDGMQVGVSGLEKQFDSQLCGAPTRFRVMPDKHGRWQSETWSLVHCGYAGYKVHLNIWTGEEIQ